MIRQLISAALAAALGALFLAGCGMSTGGGTGPAATSMQSVGPAAPPAARAQQSAAKGEAAPGSRVAIFVRPVGTGFDAASISFSTVSVKPAEGAPAPLDAAAPVEVKAGAFSLAAHGQAPPGKYDALSLAVKRDLAMNSVTFGARQAPVPLRLPEKVDLTFEPVEHSVDRSLVLVVTLDLAGLRSHKEVAVNARRLQAAPLAEDEACGLSGRVAPSSALARVYACWAKTGTPVAMTQADAFTGDYTLTGLPPGEYYLRITAPGHQAYQDVDRPLTLAAGKTVEAPAIVLSASQGLGGL